MKSTLALRFLLLAFALSFALGGAAAKPAPVAPAPNAPPPVAVLAMVRTTLLAVDHANKTGNYTVLRDMAGAQFREANTAAKLSQVFGILTLQGVDMLAVAVIEPQYKGKAKITPEKMLHVAGTFAIVPRPVNFEILYENVKGQWRVYGISIAPAT